LTGVRAVASRDQLDRVILAGFGSTRRLQAVTRLRGASKKGVYRAAFDDETTAIVYIWADVEDYWRVPGADRQPDRADPFSHASGLELFQAAHRRLDQLGVRTPQLYFADRSKQHCPADVAVVEDITGPTLEDLLDRRDTQARFAAGQLGEAVRLLHADRAPRFGKLPHVAAGGVSRGDSCEQVVLDRALRDLSESAARDERISRHRGELEDILRAHARGVQPRSDYGLIHGELGPDHVLIDRHGQPVIIDIEGLMYFDAEWEHAYLQLRFDRDYPWLRPADLDPGRLRLYRLALHLSLVAGPLRLLDGDYPERDAMLDIAEYNLSQALALLPGSRRP
jgi:tRNA A-37 threonylcarbamoyl transferase component Bud32